MIIQSIFLLALLFLNLNSLPLKRNSNLDPLWYLTKFGYLNYPSESRNAKKTASLRMLSPSSVSSNSSTFNALDVAIRKFQKFSGLNTTGKLDNATLKMMSLPRCGHPDLLASNYLRENSRTRNKRYVLQGSRWSKSKLRFKIAKYPKFSSMSKELIDKEINRALGIWSEVSDIQFEQVKDPTFMEMLLYNTHAKPPTHFGNQKEEIANKLTQKADIDVRFETGYHGDAEPFDGSGLILGNYSIKATICLISINCE